MSEELHFLPATEALRRFREGTLTPVDLLQAVISRAQNVEPRVNALCHTFYEDALDRAQAATDRWKRGGHARPLEGIPVAVKADDSIAGQPFTLGSVPMKDVVAESTSVLVKRLIDAGAIVHARTAIPEFAGAAITKSRLWGETRNPWNLDYAVGGSSGGSAAALAAGTTTLATGSDVAGSIRIPASMCGIVGYKPARGIVPIEPPGNLDTYLHLGSMARTVGDVKLMQSVIAGPDWTDLVSLYPRTAEPGDRSASGLRVAVSMNLGDWPVSDEVRRATAESAQVLRDAGALVEEVDLMLPMQDVLRAASQHYSMSLEGFDEYLNAHREALSPSLLANVAGHRRRAEGGSISEMHELEGKLWLAAKNVLEHFDVLICPTMGTSEILAGLDYAGEDFVEVNGRKYADLLEISLTTPFNILGACPVLSVPTGRDRRGVPMGMQIVGRPYREAEIFAAASALEDRAQWYASESTQPQGVSS